jgi:hypothetical protein
MNKEEARLKELAEIFGSDPDIMAILRADIQMEKWAKIYRRGKERIELINPWTHCPYCKIVWRGAGKYALAKGPSGVYVAFPVKDEHEAEELSATYLGEVDDYATMAEKLDAHNVAPYSPPWIQDDRHQGEENVAHTTEHETSCQI